MYTTCMFLLTGGLCGALMTLCVLFPSDGVRAATPEELAWCAAAALTLIALGAATFYLKRHAQRTYDPNSQRSRHVRFAAQRAMSLAQFQSTFPGEVAFERELTGEEARAANAARA